MLHIAVNARLLLPNKLEGLGWFSYQTLKHITENHTEVKFTFIFDKAIANQIVFNKSNTRCVVLHPQSRHPLLWYIFFQISTKRYLKKLKPDLYLSPDGYIPLNSSIPSLAVIHDIAFEHYPETISTLVRKYYRYFFPKFSKQASRIATVSEFTKADLVNTYGIYEDKIDVVYNGINDSFKPISQADQLKIRQEFTQGNSYFIYLGNQNARKNLHTTLSAFIKYSVKYNSDVHFVLIGGKGYLPESLDEFYQHPIHGNKIHNLGRVNDDEIVNKLVASAIAMVYISKYEGFGIPVLEAMQAGTAVITSNNSSMSEIANDAAYYVDSNGIADTVFAMNKLNTDISFRNQLVSKGYEQVKKFSWAKTSELLWQSCLKTITNK
ncbi:MAG: glycosyltransferase family 1 protein [Bacteroidota bacterium]|nr:glycosyltransferase family 1 protein [Bacteroidota bacterium]